MSDKQFDRFYWPSLQKLLIASIDTGDIANLKAMMEAAYEHGTY
jgi:hypothetical protein